MDIHGLKEELRAKRKVEQILLESEKRRLKYRKAETGNFREQFRRYFKNVHNFACPKEYEPLVASFDSIVVTLAENTERNAKEKGYKIFFILTSPDKKVHSIYADGSAFWFDNIKFEEGTEIEEIDINDQKYHEDLVNDKIIYKFKYYIEGDDRVFERVSELLEII